MKKQTCFSWGFIAAALLFAVLPARADVTFVSNRSALSLAGNITQNYGFEDLDFGDNDHVFVDFLDGVRDGRWTAFGVTYIGVENFVIGRNVPTVDGSPSGAGSNMLTTNMPDAPLAGLINDGQSLFGFEIADIWGEVDAVDVKVTTNLGEYSFLAQALTGLTFYGFSAGIGEYFTGFSITAPTGTFVALDNVTLGTMVTPVPEPEIYAMLVAGLGFLGWAGKRRKRTAA